MIKWMGGGDEIEEGGGDETLASQRHDEHGQCIRIDFFAPPHHRNYLYIAGGEKNQKGNGV